MTAPPPKPKRRRWRWLALFIVALFALGGLIISNRESFHSRAARLRTGLSRSEVVAVTGEPDRLIRLGNKDLALFTPLPFDLHALFTKPGQTLAGNSMIMATEFPAYVEFQNDIAIRVRVDGHEID